MSWGFNMKDKRLKLIRYRKVRSSDESCAYEVTNRKTGKLLGYVFSRRGFSYRGMQGWNAGVRLKDFHPWEWCWSRASAACPDRDGYAVNTREAATLQLLDSIKKV